MVSRREQLGTDDAALEKAAMDEENGDYMPDADGPADRLEGPLPSKSKPARSKSLAKAKAKSTPKARSKPKAKAKASAEEKKRKAEEKLEMNKDRAKRQCKTKPAVPAETPEPAENNAPEPPQPENAAPDKMDVESKASEKEETSKKASRARRTSEAEASHGEPKQPKDPNTFASRYMPEDEGKAARFRAIRDVFVQQVAGKLKSQSRFQDWGPSQGFIRILGPFMSIKPLFL